VVRYALCPMPYALCPMPYAVRVPNMRARKAILYTFIDKLDLNHNLILNHPNLPSVLSYGTLAAQKLSEVLLSKSAKFQKMR